MRWTGSVMAAALALAPASANAQQMMDHEMGGKRPTHETGVDVSVTYAKPDGGDGHVLIGTPVDVRLGFVTGGILEPEVRLLARFDSKQDGVAGAKSAYQLSPDINLLFNLAGYEKGVYLTAGGGVNFVKAGGLPGAGQLSVNGGIGTRVPYEHGAIRLEAFGRYDFENAANGLAKGFDAGARIGLTLWH